MNLFFISTLNQWRSLTAENIFKDTQGLSVRSAGIAKNARHRVNVSDINWAEVIFVMEKKHKRYLEENIAEAIKYKKIITLNIPDQFQYMDPEWVDILKLEVGQYL